MTKLTGKEALEFVEKLKKEDEARTKAALEKARSEAESRGKEPFDLAKLETMCDTSEWQGRIDPPETRHARYEYMYYVAHPEIMTLRELADLVTLSSRW